MSTRTELAAAVLLAVLYVLVLIAIARALRPTLCGAC